MYLPLWIEIIFDIAADFIADGFLFHKQFIILINKEMYLH